MPRPLARLLAVAAIIGLFAGLSSIIDPQGSSANPPTPANTGRSRALPQADLHAAAKQTFTPPESNDKGWPLLGQLVGHDHLVLAYGSPQGPRYTICTHSGEILQADLPADEVYRGFPDIDLERMVLDPADGAKGSTPGPLMLNDREL